MTSVDIPYVAETNPPPYQTATLGKDSWKAQWVEDEGRQQSVPTAPSVLNIPLAILSFLFCPILGILAVIFAIEARIVYNHGHILESEALSERARGTSYYAIAIGIGLLVGMGVLLGLGSRFNWY